MSDYQPIENYGIIGDLHTTALVGMDGSIDFMSFPDFDSPTIFAALLDHKKGGHFKISPKLDVAKHKQLYLPDTNVLLTRFLSEHGVAEISDFMPVEECCIHRIVRRVKTIRGEINYQMNFSPKFNYGKSSHKIEIKEKGLLFTPECDEQNAILLRSSVPVEIINGEAVAEFTLRAEETASFIMEDYKDNYESPADHPDYIASSFKHTINFWRDWISKSSYKGRWRETVNRSALTLKLLTSKHHGSIVAASTFGLPEELGGERNWDYRYTWIRDASFTLYGLIRLGFTEEAASFMNWIEARCGELNPDGSLQIMYGIDGRHILTETNLEHFEGYKKSFPVRIGNDAYSQLQLDIYGELLDSVYLYDKFGSQISYDLWQNLIRLVDWVCNNWEKKDEGIWEVRGGKQEFLYSRLMCWVAIDRGIRLARKHSYPYPTQKWESTRNKIYNEIFNDFWNKDLEAFTQYKG